MTVKTIRKLNSYHRYELLEQAQMILNDYNEQGNPEIEGYECFLNNEDNEILVLLKCSCGQYLADYEDYSERDVDTNRCPHCNKHYDYSEKELTEL